MKVLVVIPCLNEIEHLGRVVDQMLADPLCGRIVIADGGSDDGSREIAHRFAREDSRVKFLHNPSRIQSAGVNAAVARYGTLFTLFVRVDAHCIYPENYLSKLVASWRDTGAASIVVPMYTVGKGGFQTAVAAAQNSWLGNGGSPHRSVTEGRFVDHGHHALMEIGAFQHAGGYCETMIANEDAELDRRLTDLGYSIFLDPNSAIGYQPRANLVALWRQYRTYGEGRSRTIARHGMKLKARQALPLLVPSAALLAFLSPFSLLFGMPIMVYWLTAFCAGVMIGGRSGGGWTRLAGVAAIVMHCAWGFGFLIERIRNPWGTPPRYGFPKQGWSKRVSELSG